jgi:hypothetical protein
MLMLIDFAVHLKNLMFTLKRQSPQLEIVDSGRAGGLKINVVPCSSEELEMLRELAMLTSLKGLVASSVEYVMTRSDRSRTKGKPITCNMVESTELATLSPCQIWIPSEVTAMGIG